MHWLQVSGEVRAQMSECFKYEPHRLCNRDHLSLSLSLYQPSPSVIMENWHKLTPSFSITDSASRFAKGLSSRVQFAKESLGQVSQEELTELPPGQHLHLQP